MMDVEKSASARCSTTNVWLTRGESLASALAVAVRRLQRALGGGLSSLRRAGARRAALRELYRLDDRLLADIGLRREQVAELVDGMFRRDGAETVIRAPGKSTVAACGDVAGADAGNDDRFRSAA